MNSPEVLIVAALLYAAVGLAVYLALIVVVRVLARVTRRAWLMRVADALTPAIIGALFALPTAASAQTPTSDPPVVMHQLVTDETPAPPISVPPPPAAQATAQATWTIQPGQHFWAVADSVLADHLGRPPTDAEVVPYWRQLIEANRDRLRDRDNPDLVFPGQVLVLPSVPTVQTWGQSQAGG